MQWLALIPNGSYDTNSDSDPNKHFSKDGRVLTDMGTGGDQAFTGGLSGDKVIAAGRGGDSFSLARYTKSGKLDKTFSGDGRQKTVPPGNNVKLSKIEVLPSGKILAAGHAGNGASPDFAIARYTEAGALDDDFESGGLLLLDFGSSDRALSLAVQPDRKIVLAGESGVAPDTEFAVARLSSGGLVESEWGVDGRSVIPVDGNYSAGRGVLIDSNNQIVVAGETTNGGDTLDFAAVRLQTIADTPHP